MRRLAAAGARMRVHHGPEAFVKKYIRDMIDDLKRPKSKDYIPPVPQPPTDGKTIDLQQPPELPVPEDLNNQILSDDPLQLKRQLDFQAQQAEERQKLP